MDFTRPGDFFAAPFPSEELRRADGSMDPDKLGQFPNPNQVDILKQVMALLLRDTHGFAVSGAVFFSFSQDLGSITLPDVSSTLRAEAPVFLMDLERKIRHPVIVHYDTDGGPFGSANLLSLLPVQGIPLRPGAQYVAVIRRTLVDAQERRVSQSPGLAKLASGQRPDGLTDSAYASYRRALDTLAATGLAASDIAGLSVFTTDTPAAQLSRFRDDVLARPLPVPVTPFVLGDIFPDYCVFNSAVDIDDYQQGDPPYQVTGGGWAVDTDGKPVAPHRERARVVVTIPRAPMPAAGYPTAVFLRTAGGDRPMVDLGVRNINDGPPLVPGSGPAQEFARVGYAGVEIDGPLGGLRNTTGGDEQFLIFNVFNVMALRDNVRESALELIVLGHILPSLSIAANSCPGVGATVHLDQSRLAMMAHSMGATIAPLVLAWEPLYRAAILSGAGGSYLYNVLWKRRPIDVLPIAETLLKYPADRQLTESDPALTMFQWALEPADPPVYAQQIVREPLPGTAPRHILMEQGIVDHYIMPDTANVTSLSIGLDLGGAPLEHTSAELSDQTPVLAVLALVGRGQIALPASGNVRVGGVPTTAVVVQHPSDGIEDGHEVVFQTEPPKHQYRCFLLSLAAGQTPRVPGDAAADAPCP